MKNKFLETGKIVGTHGVRGMVRIQAWCDSPEFFCGLKKVYLDKEGKTALNITKSSPHGNVVIAAIKGIDSIEEAEKYRNKVLYMDRKDAKLEEGRYFICDLIGCQVFDKETSKKLGVLSDVSETGANDVWHIKDNENEYLIPAIDEVVVSVDIENETIVISPLKGIFPDEN
ncbi:MAG: 16S rRNA processing protein RimM [Clostridia bacterium]|nr:16S rRNA processing protein RimM [Clostridia bacterium]